MTRNILTRLKKLELQRPRQLTEQERVGRQFSHFLMVAVAYHLGNPSPDEAPATAYARALGYAAGF